MAKNLMPEVAKTLGVELGEEFNIENADRKETVIVAMDGFHVIQPNNVLGPDHGQLLSKVLQGLYEVKKKPFVPKEDEEYWTISFMRNVKPSVDVFIWSGDDLDFIKLKLGMVYRSEEEALEHLAEDYEKLTGKPLSSC